MRFTYLYRVRICAGGEPLVRKDAVEIIARINTLRAIGLETIAMTTNAILLHKKIGQHH
jgi:molybdenum cofactor biosynthesis enzyme MoaA